MDHQNWNKRHEQSLGRSDRIAIGINNTVGSMKFIVIATLIIIAWITFNVVSIFVAHWDPYPFILLNLAFSAFAFYSSPLILMAGNIAAARDKIQAEHQYEHQEKELALNTNLTKNVQKLAQDIHEIVAGKKEAK